MVSTVQGKCKTCYAILDGNRNGDLSWCHLASPFAYGFVSLGVRFDNDLPNEPLCLVL